MCQTLEYLEVNLEQQVGCAVYTPLARRSRIQGPNLLAYKQVCDMGLS